MFSFDFFFFGSTLIAKRVSISIDIRHPPTPNVKQNDKSFCWPSKWEKQQFPKKFLLLFFPSSTTSFFLWVPLRERTCNFSIHISNYHLWESRDSLAVFTLVMVRYRNYDWTHSFWEGEGESEINVFARCLFLYFVLFIPAIKYVWLPGSLNQIDITWCDTIFVILSTILEEKKNWEGGKRE